MSDVKAKDMVDVAQEQYNRGYTRALEEAAYIVLAQTGMKDVAAAIRALKDSHEV